MNIEQGANKFAKLWIFGDGPTYMKFGMAEDCCAKFGNNWWDV